MTTRLIEFQKAFLKPTRDLSFPLHVSDIYDSNRTRHSNLWSTRSSYFSRKTDRNDDCKQDLPHYKHPLELLSQKKWNHVKNIQKEIDELSELDGCHFSHYKLCLIFEDLLQGHEKTVMDYLKGHVSLKEIGITPQTAEQFLKLIKLFDLAIAWHNRINNPNNNPHEKNFDFPKIILKKSSYKIRRHILKLLSPGIKSCEVYTWTPNNKNFENFNYLKNPKNWLPERNNLFSRLVANCLIHTISLSNRLQNGNTSSTLYAIRGNSGSGKSTTIKNEPELRMICDEQGELAGTLNPDSVKWAIKQQAMFFEKLCLTNKQVHDEGSALFDCYRKEIVKRDLYCILDSRFIEVDFIEESIIEPTKQKKGRATLIDLDVPLLTSLNRNLCRSPYGKDPCVPLEGITTGFKKIREERSHLIKKIKEENIIKNYKLYHLDENGTWQLSAQKVENLFTVISQPFFEACLMTISEKSINQQIQQIITQTYIERAIKRKDIFPHQKNCLEKWLGRTVKEAVDEHVQGKF